MNQELLNQFLGLLEDSSSFKLMTPEQQASIKDNYQNATDEQLQQGIKALEEDKVVTTRLEAERKKNQEELENSVTRIKTRLREIKREELKEEEAVAEVSDKKEEEALLNEIETMDEPKQKEAPPKKRKKFLGIF